MTKRTRVIGVSMAAVCAAALCAPVVCDGARLGGPGEGAEWVEVDPVSMCGMLAREYREVYVRDRVTVASTTATEKRTDEFEVYVRPAVTGTGDQRFEIVLGPVRISGSGPGARKVAVTYSREPERVFEPEVGDAGPMRAIGDAMPPIPMPQVWMALSDARATCPPVGAYLGKVEWTSAEMSPESKPPKLRMKGTGAETEWGGAIVELEATLEPEMHIDRVVIRNEKESATIELTIEAMDAEMPDPVSVEGRERVASLAELIVEKKEKRASGD